MTGFVQLAWPTVRLGSVLKDIQPGFASGVHNSTGDGIPHFRPMNVSREGRVDRSVLKYVDPHAGRPDQRLRRGDIVFNNTNSPELVGKTAFFRGADEPAFSNHMTRLRVDSEAADPEYVALRLHQAWREGYFAEHCNNHVSQASIGREVLADFPIELPPLVAQRKIATLYHRVDEKRWSTAQHLSAAESAAVRCRRAVLAAACSGRLTPDWRSQNRDRTGPDEELLLQTRRPTRSGSVERPVDLELPQLPSTYRVGTVGAAATTLDYGTSKRADTNPDLGIPVLRMGNIHDGVLDLSDLKYLPRSREISRLYLKDGDLLFNRTNSPELVGKCAVFRGSTPMVFASYLIRVRFEPAVADPDYVNYWINSGWGRAWAWLAKTDGVSQSNINATKLSLMPLPLPPIEEQRLIVERASRVLMSADTIAERIRLAGRHAAALGNAVLASAFRDGIAASAPPTG